jgi:uncharacterized membrane protein
LDFFSTTAAVVAVVVGLILRFELRIFFNVRGGGVCVLDSFTSLVVVAFFVAFLLFVFVSFIFAALLFFNTGTEAAAFVVFVDLAFVDFVDFVCLLLLAQGLMDRSENAMMIDLDKIVEDGVVVDMLENML